LEVATTTPPGPIRTVSGGEDDWDPLQEEGEPTTSPPHHLPNLSFFLNFLPIPTTNSKIFARQFRKVGRMTFFEAGLKHHATSSSSLLVQIETSHLLCGILHYYQLASAKKNAERSWWEES